MRVHLIGDLVLVRCSNIFTQTETRLAVSEEGRRLIKSARQELRNIARAEIEGIVGAAVGCKVVRSYSDLDVDVSEQMEVYVLEIDLEKRLLRLDLDHLQGLSGKRQP